MNKALIVATVGGFLSQFELNNVKILQEMGYEVHYAANLENCMYSFDEKKLKEEGIILHNFPIEKAPYHLISHWRNINNIKKLIEKEKIDLVHCHTPVGGIVGRLGAWKSKRKIYVMYTAHGFHFYKGASILNWIYYPVERCMAKITDCIVTINKEDYECAKKFKLKKKGCCVQIPGIGIDEKRFSPMPELKQVLRENFDVSKDEMHLMTIGEINKNKNHEVVLKALAILRNSKIRYTIFGRGTGTEKLNDMIREYGLEEQVKFKGYCTETEIALQSADFFVFPSIREGLGMAALEALSCGVPVIAMDNRGTREYMKDNSNGIICYKSEAKAFARAIEKAYMEFSKDTLEDTYAQNARKSVEPFLICRTNEVMKGVYESVKGQQRWMNEQ